MDDEQFMELARFCLVFAGLIIVVATARGVREFRAWRDEVRWRRNKAAVEKIAAEAMAAAEELTARRFDQLLTGEIATIEVVPHGKRGRTHRSKAIAAAVEFAPEAPDEIEALPEVQEIQGEDGAVL